MSVNDLHKTKIKIRTCSFYISTQIDFSPIKQQQRTGESSNVEALRSLGGIPGVKGLLSKAAHDNAAHDRWEQASATAEPGQVESRPQPRQILLRTAAHARWKQAPARSVEPLRLSAMSPGENHLSRTRQVGAGPSRGKSSSAQQHTPGGSRPQPEAWSHSVSPRCLRDKILLSTAVLYRWEQASADPRHLAGGKQAAAGGAAPSLRDFSGGKPPQHSRTRVATGGSRPP